MLTSPEFRALYPEFLTADYPVAAVNRAIALADEIAAPASDNARAALTAHVLAMTKLNKTVPDGGAGEITHERTGSKGLMFKPMATRHMDVWFTLSPYGRFFLMLDEGRAAMPMVV